LPCHVDPNLFLGADGVVSFVLARLQSTTERIMTNIQLAILIVAGAIIGWFIGIQYPAMYPHDRYEARYIECEAKHGWWFRWTAKGRLYCAWAIPPYDDVAD
jgi:hypothetical protein